MLEIAGYLFLLLLPVCSAVACFFMAQRKHLNEGAAIITGLLCPLFGLLIYTIIPSGKDPREEALIRNGEAFRCRNCGLLSSTASLNCEHCGAS